MKYSPTYAPSSTSFALMADCKNNERSNHTTDTMSQSRRQTVRHSVLKTKNFSIER